MNDFEYYDKEPKKSGKGFLIAALIVVSVALAGVLTVQYLVPYLDNSTQPAMEAAQTSLPTEEKADDSVEQVQKVTSYLGSGSIPDIVEDVSPAIVGVMNYVETSGISGFGRQTESSEVPQSSGSGVIISEDGYIVTNNHVIEGASKVTVTLTTGEVYDAVIVGSDQYVDLAVLKIEATGLEYMTFGDSENARPGELAIAIGYPLSDDFSSVTVTAGILSAVGADVEVDGIHFEMLQTDAPINPGNSGGALVDGSGQLIGINTLKTLYAGSTAYGQTINAEGIGYAIPVHVVEPIVKDLMEEGEVVRPFLGISGRIVTELDSQSYDLPQGFYIDELTKDGPAERAGVLEKDIITELNGEPIVEFSDLYTFITKSRVGDEITLKVYRYETEETLDIKVILGSSKDY